MRHRVDAFAGEQDNGADQGRATSPLPQEALPSRTVKPAPQSLLAVLDRAQWVFLLLFAAAVPISIAGAQIAVAGAALLWILWRLAGGRVRLFRCPVDLPILAYLLFSALSCVFSYVPRASWDKMRSVALVLIALLVAHSVRSLPRAKWLVTVLLVSSLSTVAHTAWQAIAGPGLQVQQMRPTSPLRAAGVHPHDVLVEVNGRRTHNPEEFQVWMAEGSRNAPIAISVLHMDTGYLVGRPATVLVSPPATSESEQLIDWGVELGPAPRARAMGFYSHFVTYAEVLVQLAALAFGLWIATPAHRLRWRILLGGVFVGLVGALAATLTRASWLALVVACLLLVWIQLRRRWLRWGLVVLLVLAALGTDVAMRQWRGVGLFDRRDPGSDYRLLMWQDGLRLIGDHPWFGIGMESLAVRWQEFDLVAYEKYGLRLHFHSTPMQIAVERGLPTLLAWLWLVGAYTWMLWRWVRQAPPDWFVRGLALGILGAATGFLLSSTVHYNFGDSEVVMLFWLLLGTAVGVYHRTKNGTPVVQS